LLGLSESIDHFNIRAVSEWMNLTNFFSFTWISIKGNGGMLALKYNLIPQAKLPFFQEIAEKGYQ
jgi:hypothetical protein